MVKCDTCNNTLKETFLNKPLGTMVKKEGKKTWLCSACQKKQH